MISPPSKIEIDQWLECVRDTNDEYFRPKEITLMMGGEKVN